MTKEPADWAKIKAYREIAQKTYLTDAGILEIWPHLPGVRELARMYDQYEKPPVDPDLLAAREFTCGLHPEYVEVIRDGCWDHGEEIKSFLAGIKHGGSNP